MGALGNEARGWESLGTRLGPWGWESLGMRLGDGEPGNETRGWESLGMRLGDGRAWE